jgi:hypothetical protein
MMDSLGVAVALHREDLDRLIEGLVWPSARRNHG